MICPESGAEYREYKCPLEELAAIVVGPAGPDLTGLAAPLG